MLKAVIFDVDGTLIDSVDAHARAWRETLLEFGHEIPLEDVRGQIGKGGDELLRTFLAPEEIHGAGEAIERARKERFRRDYLPAVRGFPVVRNLFERLLADGRQVVLASSAVGEELAAYKEKAGITDLVKDQTSKDDAEKSKPHPDIFLAALAKLPGVVAAEALVIGDSPWDALAARRAGLRMIGLLSGGFPESELTGAGVDVIYQDPAELFAQYDDSPLAEPKL